MAVANAFLLIALDYFFKYIWYNIHLESVLINEKVYQARQDLKLVKGVELLSQPAVPSSPANPSAMLLLIAALAGAY